MQSCCSPVASACPPIAQLLLSDCIRFESAAAPHLRPLSAALPNCARFSCCCTVAACVRFSCCSRSRPLRLLLPDCVRFDCCSPIACTYPLAAPAGFQPNVLEHSSRSSRFSTIAKLKYEVAHHYSLVPPHKHPTSVTHRHTNTC